MGQILVQQRLTNAVQHRSLHLGELLSDGCELIEGQALDRLAREKGARTGLAQQVAAIGDLDKDHTRRQGGDSLAAGVLGQAIGVGQEFLLRQQTLAVVVGGWLRYKGYGL